MFLSITNTANEGVKFRVRVSPSWNQASDLLEDVGCRREPTEHGLRHLVPVRFGLVELNCLAVDIFAIIAIKFILAWLFVDNSVVGIITWLVVVEPVEVAGVAVSVTVIVCVRSCVFVRVVDADWTLTGTKWNGNHRHFLPFGAMIELAPRLASVLRNFPISPIPLSSSFSASIVLGSNCPYLAFRRQKAYCKLLRSHVCISGV